MTRLLRRWVGKASTTLTSARFWSAVGVLSASAIMVNVNVLSARFYERWDVTQSRAFTLSPATLEILDALAEPVEVVVFLSQGDRLLVDVRHMLSEYKAHSRKLEVRYVDPERDPAEFLALQQRFGITAGKTEQGRLLTDASLVVARGAERWFITADDLMGLDAEGNVEPRIEHALTEGIAQVTRGEALSVCFTTGHQEISIDDAGPHGLAELRMRLTKSNLTVETRDLSATNLTRASLASCHLVLVVGPKSTFGEPAARALRSYYEHGGNLLLLLDPFVDDQGRLGQSGLEPVTAAVGINLQNDFVIEQDRELRLPNGFGEAFLATPEPHAVTEGLMGPGNRAAFRVLLVGAQSLSTEPSSPAKPLLMSSATSFTLEDLKSVQQGDRQLVPLSNDETGPYPLALAVAARRAKPDAAKEHRMVVVGAANLAWSRNWRDPTLVGNRLFVENAVAWLCARPALVSVPKRRSFPAGLSLTEQSQSDVLWYVMVYMPLTAAFMGSFVLFRRRRQEARSRRAPAAEDRAA